MNDYSKRLRRNGKFYRPEPDLCIDKSGDCWLWTGAKSDNGYGIVTKWGEKYRYAHRYFWEKANGPIPKGMMVCHKCDNPPCVRLDHLFLGTQLDNMRDMDRKGRRVRVGTPGEAHPRAKLTNADVLLIRQEFKSGTLRNHLAKRYGVSFPTIKRVVDGENWKHLLGGAK